MTADLYTIVPKEPDDNMELAGAEKIRVETSEFNRLLMSNRSYKVMLSVAPKDHNLTLIDRDELEALRRDAERYQWLRHG